MFVKLSKVLNEQRMVGHSLSMQITKTLNGTSMYTLNVLNLLLKLYANQSSSEF